MSPELKQQFLSRFQPNGSAALNVQLAAYLRDGMVAGVFAGGERLPSLRTLSRLCRVNYFSVQLATEELRRDGLLYKVQGKGMFVRDFEPRQGLVGILVIEEPRHQGGSQFVHAVVNYLGRMLSERGFESVVYHDNRLPEERGTIPEYLEAMIRGNRLAALISCNVPRESRGWFDRLPIPRSEPGMMVVGSEHGSLFAPLKTLLDSGRFRRPLLLFPGWKDENPTDNSVWQDLLAAGLDPRDLPLGLLDVRTMEHEDFAREGYRVTRQVFAGPEWPDLLCVYPDVAMPGVTAALLEAGVRVPEQLTVVAHRNRELPVFCPFPVICLDVSIEEYAARLLEGLWRFPERMPERSRAVSDPGGKSSVANKAKRNIKPTLEVVK